MKRLIIKGSCNDIDKNINYILNLCSKAYDLVKIVGIICVDRDYESIDGIPCVKENFIEYDYIIILEGKERLSRQLKKHLIYNFYEKILEPASKLIALLAINGKKKWENGNKVIDKIYAENFTEEQAIVDNKIISSNLLYTPGFEFAKYIELRENGVSIISNNCWGGFAYHYLGIPMKSPFINMWMLPEDYMRLINNLEYYLNQKLEIVDSGYDRGKKKWYPVVALGDVKMQWNHCFTLNQLDESVRQFLRRSKRVDYDRLLAFVYFEGEGLAEKYENEFVKSPIKHKIGISYDYEGNNIYLASDYLKDKKMFGEDFFKYVNAMVERDKYPIVKPFDLFKLLNLEDDYLRL